MKRTRAAAAVAAATLLSTVASYSLWTASSATADDTLGSGFQSLSLSAVGGGQRVIADGIANQGSGTIDSGIPDAEATMTATSGHALSSVAWPSSLVGNAGSLLFLLGPYPCSPSHYFGDPIPPVPSECSPVATPDAVMAQYHYLNSPLRAEASYPVKPADTNSIPGATMTAAADDVHAASEAILGVTYSTDVERVTSARANSQVKLTGVAGAVADASSTITGIDIAGGIVTIASVASVAHGETDGVKGKSSGSTTIYDMRVNGIPVTVDDKGVHVTGQTADAVGPATKAVNQVLGNFGMTMFETRPTQHDNGGIASYEAGSLIIEWAPPGDSCKNKTALQCGMIFEFGGAHVTAAATPQPSFDFEDTSSDVSSVVDSSTGEVAGSFNDFSPVGVDVAGSVITPTIRTGRRSGGSPTLNSELAVNQPQLPHGTSAWWLVIGLLAVVSLGAGLLRLPDRLLAASGSTCGDDA